jgi:hypothetical protein
LVTVAGATGVAVALRATVVPAVIAVEEVGEVIATDGAVTLTLTIVEVAVVPLESVTRAVRAKIPAELGAH